MNSSSDNLTGMVVPQHVAIIMDGNGRWAKQRGKLRISGHRAGLNLFVMLYVFLLNIKLSH